MKIGIIYAIPQEKRFFDLQPNSSKVLACRTCYQKKDTIHELIVYECGLGKVNEAMVPTLLIQEYAYNTIIFAGVEGVHDPTI